MCIIFRREIVRGAVPYVNPAGSVRPLATGLQSGAAAAGNLTARALAAEVDPGSA